jgi:pyruvate/2-oxoglutarate dehydrogenase complex dihydrolipoamide acyltransferase (E2) component
VRTVLLAAAVLVTLAVGFVIGVAAGRSGEDTASAPPRPETVERTVESTVTVQAPTTATTSAVPEPAAQFEATCRLLTYTSEEEMSAQEGDAFSERVAKQMAREMQEDPSLTAGPAQNAALDHFGVPRYAECKVGGG